jgi:hypothetical protein
MLIDVRLPVMLTIAERQSVEIAGPSRSTRVLVMVERPRRFRTR